jgi:hypothetical protein
MLQRDFVEIWLLLKSCQFTMCMRREETCKRPYLIVGSCQSFGESLPHRRQSVECLIAGSPESVASNVLRSLDNFQDSVVGWYTFKGDTAKIQLFKFQSKTGLHLLGMPSFASKPLRTEESVFVQFFCLLYISI